MIAWWHMSSTLPDVYKRQSLEFGERSVQCDKARLAHGLPLLVEADWVGVMEAEKNPLPET